MKSRKDKAIPPGWFVNFHIPKMEATHPFLSALEVTLPNKLIIGWIHFYFRQQHLLEINDLLEKMCRFLLCHRLRYWNPQVINNTQVQVWCLYNV